MQTPYVVHEFDSETCEPTGLEYVYLGDSAEQVARKALYYRKLKDGNAKLGPTGRVVHSNGKSYVVVKENR